MSAEIQTYLLAIGLMAAMVIAILGSALGLTMIYRCLP